MVYITGNGLKTTEIVSDVVNPILIEATVAAVRGTCGHHELMTTRIMKRVRFTYLDRIIKEPIIYKLGHNFDVVTNIRRADVQEGVGWVILEIDESRLRLNAA